MATKRVKRGALALRYSWVVDHTRKHGHYSVEFKLVEVDTKNECDVFEAECMNPSCNWHMSWGVEWSRLRKKEIKYDRYQQRNA